MQPKPSKQLTILVISGTWPPMPCGVGDYTQRLCNWLVMQNVCVHVATSRDAAQGSVNKPSDRLTVHATLDDWSNSMLVRIEQLVLKIQPDCLLFQWPTAVYGRSLAVTRLPGFLKKKFPRIPLVMTLHELRYFRVWTRWRIKPALQQADYVAYVDPLDLDVLQQLLPGSATKSAFIPIGSNMPSVQPGYKKREYRKLLGIASDRFVMVFFGFANPPKGLESLFEAMAEIKKKSQDICLIMLPALSTEHGYQRKLLQSINSLGLTENVFPQAFAEPAEVAKILSAADCAVLPFEDGVSFKRGSFLACVEQALPIITTRPKNPGAFPFADGRDVLYAEPGDARSLVEAVETLRTNARLCQQLSKNVKKLQQQFRWESIARQYIHLFESLLEVGP